MKHYWSIFTFRQSIAMRSRRHEKKGVHFAVASGRARFMVQSILEEVGTAECEDEYSICYNGAAVYRNNDPRPLFVSPLCFRTDRGC